MTSASQQQRHRALDILGLAESATADEIARAWRELVRENHPDLTGDSSPATVDRLRNIMWAHRTLTRTPEPADAVPRMPVRVTVKPATRSQPASPIIVGPTRVRPARDSAPGARRGDPA